MSVVGVVNKNTPSPLKIFREEDYPVLGCNTRTGKVVLFTSHGKGTEVVSSGSGKNDMGYVSHHWAMTEFEKLPAGSEVILRQGALKEG